jgi:hypothetical protein
MCKKDRDNYPPLINLANVAIIQYSQNLFSQNYENMTPYERKYYLRWICKVRREYGISSIPKKLV